MIYRTLQQKICLVLWGHLIEGFDFMFRQDIGRSGFWLTGKADELRNLFPYRLGPPVAHRKSQQNHKDSDKGQRTSASHGGLWALFWNRVHERV
jgi:hypothetical protein